MHPFQIPIERELDLHAFAPARHRVGRRGVRDAAAQAGFSEVRLVHGRGRGVQRGIVQAALERHPLVVRVLGRYRRAPGRDGAVLNEVRSLESGDPVCNCTSNFRLQTHAAQSGRRPGSAVR